MPLSGNFSFFFFLIYFLSLLSFRMRMVDDLYPRGSMIVNRCDLYLRSIGNARKYRWEDVRFDCGREMISLFFNP